VPISCKGGHNLLFNILCLDNGGHYILFDTFIKKDDRIRQLMIERCYQKSNIDAAIIKADQYNQNLIESKFITNWDEEEKYYIDYYRIIAKELGNIELTNELFHFTHYAAHCKLFSEAKEVLKALTTKYRLGVISNAMPSMDWIFDRLGIRKYFDSIILSAFANESKPGKAIYNIALKQLKTTAEESIFIDDKLENIKGAERVGINAFHLDREKMNLYELLKKQEIL
jgi:putative hydrolase of the HAD superfamily